MSALGADLRSMLAGRSGVNGLAGDRCYCDHVPQGTARPYVVVALIANPGHHGLLGPVGFATPTFQVDVVADDGQTRDDLAEAVRGALEEAALGPVGSDHAFSVRIDSATDSYDPPTDGSGAGVFLTRFDVTVTHARSVPA